MAKFLFRDMKRSSYLMCLKAAMYFGDGGVPWDGSSVQLQPRSPGVVLLVARPLS